MGCSRASRVSNGATGRCSLIVGGHSSRYSLSRRSHALPYQSDSEKNTRAHRSTIKFGCSKRHLTADALSKTSMTVIRTSGSSLHSQLNDSGPRFGASPRMSARIRTVKGNKPKYGQTRTPSNDTRIYSSFRPAGVREQLPNSRNQPYARHLPILATKWSARSHALRHTL